MTTYNCCQKPISFTSYKSVMVETVNKAVHDKVATIHCAYSGEILSNAKNQRATIEHVKAHADEGLNYDFNFLLVKRKYNQLRACIPLDEYIKVHPEIVENTKITIAEVARLKSKRFDGIKWAREAIENFFKETHIWLKIDLDNIGPTIFVNDKIKKPKTVIEKVEPKIVKKTFQQQLEEVKKKLNF